MADKPPYPLHPFTMEDLELQMGSDENILKEHGLNKPLRFPDGSLNTIELDRQIDYLLYHHQEIPLSTLNRHAVMLLNCYIHGNKTPPPNLGLLFKLNMQRSSRK